jgi:hypothetical protein
MQDVSNILAETASTHASPYCGDDVRDCSVTRVQDGDAAVNKRDTLAYKRRLQHANDCSDEANQPRDRNCNSDAPASRRGSWR